MKRYIVNSILVVLAVLLGADAAFAQDGGAMMYAPIGAGLAIGLAAVGGTLGQSKAISSGLDAIGRNPSARGDIFTPMLIGLAFVESLVILAFVIALGLS